MFISDVPLNCNEGTKGNQLLEITLPEGCCDLTYYELVEEPKEKTYREWCIPVEIINRGATVRLLNEEESEEAERKRYGFADNSLSGVSRSCGMRIPVPAGQRPC